MPGIGWRREVLAIHQEQGCGSYQTDDGRAKTDISTMPIEYTDVTKKYNKAVYDDLCLTGLEGYVEIEA